VPNHHGLIHGRNALRMPLHLKGLQSSYFRVVAFRRSTPQLAIVVIRNERAMRISASPTPTDSNSHRINNLQQIRSLLMFATPRDAHHYTETPLPSASPCEFSQPCPRFRVSPPARVRNSWVPAAPKNKTSREIIPAGSKT